MKKYFLAGVVAMVAFAMAAFAASLNVDGGVIQAGADDTLTCGNDGIDDNVDISYGTSNNTVGHWVGELHLDFDEVCAGNWVILNAFGDGVPGARPQVLSLVSATTIPADGQITLDIFDGATMVEDLETVQVLVKDELVTGSFEYPGFEASGSPGNFQVRSTPPAP